MLVDGRLVGVSSLWKLGGGLGTAATYSIKKTPCASMYVAVAEDIAVALGLGFHRQGGV